MPIGSILLVLLGLMLLIDRTLAVYSDVPERATLLSQLFLENRYMPTAKRTSDRPAGITETYECCPSITRGIAPLGGLSRDGALLQLFRDSNTVQKFYETTCAPDVHNNSCKFIDSSAFSSRCVQQYTYTYAIVKDFNVTQPYRFDLMKIKSGCSCMVDVRIPEEEIVHVEKRLIDELTEEILLDG